MTREMLGREAPEPCCESCCSHHKAGSGDWAFWAGGGGVIERRYGFCGRNDVDFGEKLSCRQ